MVTTCKYCLVNDTKEKFCDCECHIEGFQCQCTLDDCEFIHPERADVKDASYYEHMNHEELNRE